MEDFIEEIYNHSFIISNLKEYIILVNSGRLSDARGLYNETMQHLEQWLEILAMSDIEAASYIQHSAIKIKDCYEDYCYSTGLVDSLLLPALYRAISVYNTINVSDGRYAITSSDTGFLTIKTEDTGRYLHSSYDPMHEAYLSIKAIYKPETEVFYILGCGLGYEVWQLFHQSDGAVKIFLYEEDSSILSYARLYGVLSLIPEENLEIINYPSTNDLAYRFLEDTGQASSCCIYVSPSKKELYHDLCDGEMNRLITNKDFDLENSERSIINLWKNKKLKRTTFIDIKNRYQYKDWIVVSAGPSLDDCISFLKDSSGTRGIIAVNTVVRRLFNESIIPDIITAADPSNNLLKHIEGLESSIVNVPLIADWLLSWKYASVYNGDICFVRTNASADVTNYFLPDDPVWDISGTVASLAIEAAVHLDAQRIYLVGQDLAYPFGKMYSKGMPHPESSDSSQSWNMKVLSVDGRMIDSCDAFEWFRKAIEYQIAKYSNVRFINMSKHGAFIKGTVTPSFNQNT